MIKLIFIVTAVLAFPAFAQEKLFHLEDLAEKINSGVTADQYCNNKAETSLKQAQASKAPIEAQQQIKYWVSVACSLDIIAEAERVEIKK